MIASAAPVGAGSNNFKNFWSAGVRRPAASAAAMRSGRAAAVRARDCSRRQRAMAAWLPLVSTSGTLMPRKSAGRVYWGYSRRPLVKDSSTGPSAAPSTPGSLRTSGIDDHHGGQLAGGEHVVPQRDNVVGQGVDALVDALVVAADEQQVVGGGELIGVGVVEGAALGG